MNIEDLTIKEAREIAAMFGGGPSPQAKRGRVSRIIRGKKRMSEKVAKVLGYQRKTVYERI